MRDTREQQFIAAAISVIGADGLHNASNAKIAAAAGLSASLLPHYFPDKSLLLRGVLRFLLRQRRSHFLQLLAASPSPIDRLHAVIEVHFAPDMFSVPLKRLWQDLHHAAHQSEALYPLQHAYQKRLLSVVRAEMRRLVNPRVLDSAAIGFTALLHGLWLKTLQEPAPLTPDEAASLQKQYLVMITMRIRVKTGDRLA